MSQRTYPVGTTQVPFVLAVDKKGPVSGLTVNARILRPSDGFEWDFSDDSFKAPGSVVTPQLTLTESVTQPGLYLGVWDVSSIVLPTEAAIIYQSTAAEIFIEDDQVIFQSGSSTVSVTDSFVEPVIDATQRTLTLVYGLRDSNSGILPTSGATVTVKDELGNTLLTQASTSASGIYRSIFPNVQIAPNRVVIVEVVYTLGLGTFITVEALKVLGKA